MQTEGKMKAKMHDDEEVALGDNLEQLLWEINDFCGGTNTKQEEIPPALDNYLKYVAKTGNTVFPWQHVRPLFRMKMLAAIGNFSGEICVNESFVLERFDLFRAAPFTIQRLAELITQPNRHYKIKEKFLRGLEKTVLVVTTIEPKSLNSEEEDIAVADEPMSWMSSTVNDGVIHSPSDSSTKPEFKPENDLGNLNQLIATVHPAPDVEPTFEKDASPEAQSTSSEQDDHKDEKLPHSEPGITDIDMPLNIASSSLDYGMDATPSSSSSFNLNSTVTPSAAPKPPTSTTASAPESSVAEDTSPKLVTTSKEVEYVESASESGEPPVEIHTSLKVSIKLPEPMAVLTKELGKPQSSEEPPNIEETNSKETEPKITKVFAEDAPFPEDTTESDQDQENQERPITPDIHMEDVDQEESNTPGEQPADDQVVEETPTTDNESRESRESEETSGTTS